MAEFCENSRVNIPFYIAMVFFIVSILLFIFGGVDYRREGPKEANYEEDICLVLIVGYRNHHCPRRGSNFINCYTAAWDVQLSKRPSINATVESQKKYQSIDDALKKTTEYQVNTNIDNRV